MFSPHPSNPLLYQLKCPFKMYIYGTYEEILVKLKKYGYNPADFIQSTPGVSTKYYGFPKNKVGDYYIEALNTSFIRDCININCQKGYKKSIISALCRKWNLNQNIPARVLWEALGKDDFQRDITLAPYRLIC